MTITDRIAVNSQVMMGKLGNAGQRGIFANIGEYRSLTQISFS